jgi:hypothetical protein
MVEDRLALQLRYILAAEAADSAMLEKHAGLLEEKGWRIVDGGQTAPYDADGQCDFACRDWRTGVSLFSGHGTLEDFGRLMEAGMKEEGRTWCLVDQVNRTASDGKYDRVYTAEPELVGGIPESLAEALQDWATSRATPGELSTLTGLTVAEVQELLLEPSE